MVEGNRFTLMPVYANSAQRSGNIDSPAFQNKVPATTFAWKYADIPSCVFNYTPLENTAPLYQISIRFRNSVRGDKSHTYRHWLGEVSSDRPSG